MNEAERIQAFGCWKGVVSTRPLTGGITNRNYFVDDEGRSFVVRLCEDRSHLAIDRRNERVCQSVAAEVGLAPTIIHHEDGVLVSEFIMGRTLSVDDTQDPILIRRLAAMLRKMHDVRHQLHGEMLYFCPFQTVRTYAATARKLGAKLPHDMDVCLGNTQSLARKVQAFHPTLCHNDLLAANILDDGNRLWLVDWEYAGIGNPLFDLASISANCQLSTVLETLLLNAYAGQPDSHVRQQVQILKVVSLLREALWAFIQTVTSTIEFDYADYAFQNLECYRTTHAALGGN